jgi:4-methyl-5(b-hydroxyethyl)-thiazole monophosphate biosynthesis
MKKVAVIVANGTEELEALTPVDVLRRANAVCDIVSIYGKTVNGSHGIIITADKTLSEVNFNDYDAIVIPGGMPGATNISACEKVVSATKTMLEEGKLVASICASPAVVLASNGLIKGKKVTCYPAQDFIKMLSENTYTGSDVEISENLITANGPKSAMKFSNEICAFLSLTPKF